MYSVLEGSLWRVYKIDGYNMHYNKSDINPNDRVEMHLNNKLKVKTTVKSYGRPSYAYIECIVTENRQNIL